jgi:hypothetical protein
LAFFIHGFAEENIAAKKQTTSMKKGIIYIVIIAVLTAVAYYLVRESNYQTSIQNIEAEYDFAIADTASVTKIIISDKTPGRVELTRTANGWMVNDKFEARPDAIEVLLETFNRMSMRNFVDERTQKTIVNRIAVYGKEVEVYTGDKRIKHFYVGTETPDQTGTYMLLEGASQPFSVHIQGFVGYLNSRFFTEEDLWRRRILFGIAKENIANINMQYTGDDASSFKVDYTTATPKLTDQLGAELPNVQHVNLNIYLGSFRTASYEGAILPSDGVWAKRDSIKNSVPVFTLEIISKDGQKKSMTAHRKRPDKEQIDGEGVWMDWDPDRMYAFLEDGRMVLIQYYGLKNIIVDRSFFSQKLITDN